MTISPPSERLVGQQSPRIHSRPDYVSSAGEEAIELAESAGLFLDPWQQLVLTDSLGERRDGKWSAFEVGLIVSRQNGKGSVLEARELAGLFLFGEKTIVHTSHLFSTSLDAFRRIRQLIESTPDLDRQVNQYRSTTGQEGIELISGARLRFLARSKGSGRGWPVDLVVWDEAYELNDEHVDALMPTLSSRPNPQVWYTSSPVLDSVSGQPLTALRKRGIAGGPNLAYFEWSAPLGADLDDRRNWAMANPAMGYRISEEFVERERGAMSDAGFARERLCIWPPDGMTQWLVITEDQWTAAADPDVAMSDPVAMCIDTTPDRASTAIAMAGAVGEDVAMEVIDQRDGTGWVPGRVVELVRRWKPCRLVIDAKGAAGALIPDIEAALKLAKLKCEIVDLGYRGVAAAYGMVYDALTGKAAEDDGLVDPEVPRVRRLWHRDDPRLTAAVAGATTRKVGSEGTAWDRRDTAVNISPLVACTGAVWGYVTRPAPAAAAPMFAFA